jgi:hypothetical protein
MIFKIIINCVIKQLLHLSCISYERSMFLIISEKNSCIHLGRGATLEHSESKGDLLGPLLATCHWLLHISPWIITENCIHNFSVTILRHVAHCLRLKFELNTDEITSKLTDFFFFVNCLVEY